MSKILGYWSVQATNHAEFNFDTKGMTLDEIADRMVDEHPGISEIGDPELVDLIEFCLGGKTYVRKNGKWVRVQEGQ